MLTRLEQEEREEQTLAPYAMKSSRTRGRRHREAEHPLRSVYQRDRDRIIHSLAFRKLEYKTQVFVNHEGDYYRTRLTHTLEVAQIARTVARALRLNEDLTEAITLAHDIGHTPFGHSGEEALATLMKDFGGFEHNLQGLRVVDKLERRYPEFEGLNLSWEVREGIAKHSTDYDRPGGADFDPGRPPTIEAQVVNAADQIAYDNHDLDDGLTSGLIEEEALKVVPLFGEAAALAEKTNPGLEPRIRHYQIVRTLINLSVSDLLRTSDAKIKAIGADRVREGKESVIAFSREMEERRKPLKDFLFRELYCHYRVMRMANKAQRYIEELFSTYRSDVRQLPPEIQRQVAAEGKERAICDYLAGMTDRFALDEYKRLFEPYERV